METVIQAIKNLVKYKSFSMPDREAREAYNLWAENYDDQPDNLMFYLDHRVFAELMHPVNVTGKNIADIGCGTGRHWPSIYQNHPQHITGYDVSEGMLHRLKTKFPDADTMQITDNFLADIAAETYDIIISTLTVAHIENIEEALAEWSRVLKKGGDIIITDFHPKALAAGGKRTFKHQNTSIPIVNFVHPTHLIRDFFIRNGFDVIHETERVIDDTVMHFYIKQDAMSVYQKFRGMPMIYGLHLKNR